MKISGRIGVFVLMLIIVGIAFSAWFCRSSSLKQKSRHASSVTEQRDLKRLIENSFFLSISQPLPKSHFVALVDEPSATLAGYFETKVGRISATQPVPFAGSWISADDDDAAKKTLRSLSYDYAISAWWKIKIDDPSTKLFKYPLGAAGGNRYMGVMLDGDTANVFLIYEGAVESVPPEVLKDCKRYPRVELMPSQMGRFELEFP